MAVSPLSDVEERVLAVVNPPYPLLADPKHQVAEAFAVYDRLGSGYATPSVFIIDTDGDIAWSYISQTSADRPSAISVLEHLP